MYKINPNVLCRKDMLLNTDTGKAYTLNPTASVIWQLLQKGCSITEIREFFKLPAETEWGIEKFICDLEKQGFIREE